MISRCTIASPHFSSVRACACVCVCACQKRDDLKRLIDNKEDVDVEVVGYWNVLLAVSFSEFIQNNLIHVGLALLAIQGLGILVCIGRSSLLGKLLRQSDFRLVRHRCSFASSVFGKVSIRQSDFGFVRHRCGFANFFGNSNFCVATGSGIARAYRHVGSVIFPRRIELLIQLFIGQ